MEKNYSTMQMGTFKMDLAAKKRVMAGEELGLTGAEISVNYMPAGKYTPFVHSHKLNEEIYIFLSGTGAFMVDEDEFPVQEGSIIRVAPAGQRAIKAGEESLAYICIQAQAGSLTQATHEDGEVSDGKASWMKE